MTTIANFANHYAEKTGCDKAQAMKAAFDLGAMLACVADQPDVMAHFVQRSEEMDEQPYTGPMVAANSPSEYDYLQMDTYHKYTANEVNEKQALARHGAFYFAP